MEILNAYYKGIKHQIIVDNGILAKLHGYTFNYNPNTKAVVLSSTYNNETLLHRIICNAQKGELVIWKNENHYDCRSSNLEVREMTNNRSSKYHGVQKVCVGNKWEAKIKFPNCKISRSLGCYDTQEEAALVYDYYSRLSKGMNTTRVNFPIYSISQRIKIK